MIRNGCRFRKGSGDGGDETALVKEAEGSRKIQQDLSGLGAGRL
jgi:hypothetical protein